MKKLALTIVTIFLSITVALPALAQVQATTQPAKAAASAAAPDTAAPVKPQAPQKIAATKAAPVKARDPKAANPEPKKDMREFYLIAIMVIMGAAVVGGTLALALVGAKVVSGVVRNPGSRPAVMPLLLLSMALIESVVIYGLVVTVLLYAKL